MTKKTDSKNTKPTKIAMLGSMPPLRALSSYCFELSQAIADYGEIECLSFKRLYPSLLYPGRNLKKDPTFPKNSNTNIRVKRSLTWYNPLTWFWAGFFIKSDILHAQWWSLPLFPIYTIICIGFKLRRIPVVFTVHNVLPHEKSILYKPLTHFLFKFIDHFIVHTSSNVKELSHRYTISKDRISLIPHGTLDFHLKKNINRDDIRNELGFQKNNKVILFFGAIRPYKGLDTLIRSFSEISKMLPDARLLIAGKLWGKWQPYHELMKSLNIIDFVTTQLEYIPSGNVYKYFTSSDLVVLPYHHFNSQSGIATTAIAFRKPLIVTRVGGLPDLVADKRFVVPPKNSDALAKSMMVCLPNHDELKAMSISANHIAQDISWSAIAKTTYDVYHKLLTTY